MSNVSCNDVSKFFIIIIIIIIILNGKDVFWAFMDLEKAYDTIDRHGMWQMLRVYAIGGNLLKTVKCFYIDSRACVQVGNDVSEWFPVNVGLRQGCVKSPCSLIYINQYNVYIFIAWFER